MEQPGELAIVEVGLTIGEISATKQQLFVEQKVVQERIL